MLESVPERRSPAICFDLSQKTISQLLLRAEHIYIIQSNQWKRLKLWWQTNCSSEYSNITWSAVTDHTAQRSYSWLYGTFELLLNTAHLVTPEHKAHLSYSRSHGPLEILLNHTEHSRSFWSHGSFEILLKTRPIRDPPDHTVHLTLSRWASLVSFKPKEWKD